MIIGFIGLGTLGRLIAEKLIKAGYKLIICGRFAKLGHLLNLGADEAASNREVASGSEIIITVLPNPAQMKEAILGVGGVIEGLKKGTIVVDMSSITHDLSEDVNVALKEKNAAFLDVHISGEVADAKNGMLSVTVEGDRNAFEKVKPILEKIASHIEINEPV